jgi:hypothetical protein
MDRPSVAGEDVRVFNRSQILVLAFFAAVLVVLVAIRAVAPGIYSDALPAGTSPALINGMIAAIVAFVVLLAIGVVRRWRWLFWLIVIAFVAGLLRLPAAILEIRGVLPSAEPTWYVVLQALIGAIQFAIGLALIRGYRRQGVWGS